MKVLLTGASGFLGSIIRTTLSDEFIITLNRSGGVINADLSKTIPVLPQVDIVLHAAGKAHSFSKENAQEFFNTNVTGTINLLKGLENSAIPKAFIFISSVAVYGKESGLLIDEEEPLSAIDPYGTSKIEAENIVVDWCRRNNVVPGILRVPLIVGPNPPGNLRAMIEGIRKGFYFNINGGHTRKSMVLAKDIAAIIPKLSQIGGIYNLTDGYHPSFSELSRQISAKLNKKSPPNLPLLAAKIMAKIGDLLGPVIPINSNKLKKIISPLTFDDAKARKDLGWNPEPVLDNLDL